MNDFQDFLNFDPLLAAEEITGYRLGENSEINSVSIGLSMLFNETKRDELALRDDSFYNIEYNRYVSIIKDLGFVRIYNVVSSHNAYSDKVSVFECYWKDGLLLVCDSFQDKLNSAVVYFNAEFTENNWGTLGLSGFLNGPAYDDEKRKIWVGYISGVEAIRHNLARLENAATILPSWVESPGLWLLTIGEQDRSSESVELTSEKIAQFPSHVRSAMNA